jgi:hypothetical protein
VDEPVVSFTFLIPSLKAGASFINPGLKAGLVFLSPNYKPELVFQDQHQPSGWWSQNPNHHRALALNSFLFTFHFYGSCSVL